MSNMERSAALCTPPSSRFSEARRVVLVADATPREPTAAASRNPFSSFAPTAAGAAREMNAETKVYEVPRELIEIARARANGAEPAGKTTPLAPRPDAELEATLRAYTARLSTKPPRVPSVLLDEAIAADVAAEPAAPIAVERTTSAPAAALEPKPLLLERRPASRRPALRDGAALKRAAHPASESRAWMVYAALSLMGLASCAHVLLAP
jgi:hypothetical protein